MSRAEAPSRRVFAGLGLSLLAATATAIDPPRILSGGALEPGVEAVLALWRARGEAATAAYATAPRIAERLAAGERPDLVFAPTPFVGMLAASGALAAAPTPLGAVQVGVAVRDGTAPPDLSSEDSFRAALLAADAVIFNRASTGLYLERLLERTALAEPLARKIVRFPDGDGVLRRVASGTGHEVAVAATTEILLFRDRGVRLVGPLPGAWRSSTSYAAGLLRESAGNEPARRVLAFLETPEARAALAAAGVA